jgi:Ribbon-helix-helix domain
MPLVPLPTSFVVTSELLISSPTRRRFDSLDGVPSFLVSVFSLLENGEGCGTASPLLPDYNSNGVRKSYCPHVCLLDTLGPAMERTSIFFPKQQMARLKKLAQRLDIKVAELIRRAVEEFLERKEGGK